MKKIVCFVLGILLLVQAAGATDYLANRAFRTPTNVEKNKYSLVHHLTKGLEDDYDKLKVIAYWIASHIAYDDYKYSNEKGLNTKELRLQYDILEKKSGICGDFAQLFADMANIANAGKVSIVHGYVLENVKSVKRKYRRKDVKNLTGHAWNLVKLQDRKFFVDTTWMARSTLRQNTSSRVSSLNHRKDLRKQGRNHEANQNINEFYFDFTPKTEVREYKQLHLQNKYIK